MKRLDLIHMLVRNGWKFDRDGGKHDIYAKDGEIVAIPRHREIDEILAMRIIRKQGLK